MLLTVQNHFIDKKLVVQPFAMLCMCILPLSFDEGFGELVPCPPSFTEVPCHDLLRPLLESLSTGLKM